MKKQIFSFFHRFALPLALLFWIGVWWLIAGVLGKPLLLPTPPATVKTLLEMMLTAAFWQNVGLSLLRVFGGILAALLTGTLLAVAAGRFALLDRLFSPLLHLFKTTPVASVVFLLLLFIGRELAPFFIAFMPTLPIVFESVKAGLLSVDGQLLEMASAFRVPQKKITLTLRIPAALPYFLAACRSAIGLGFKAGVAAEVLCLPPYSIGTAIYESRLYLATNELFAYTLAVILLGVAIERLTLFLLPKNKKEARANAHD